MGFVIALSSPRKGQGQTVTGINIAALMSKTIHKEVLFIDTNKLCKDVEYYLSDSHFTKGLDDFLSYCTTNKINDDNFFKCMKDTNFGLKIMTSNKCFELTHEYMGLLCTYAKEFYPYTFIDTSSAFSDTILEHADKIIVVVSQMDCCIRMLETNEFYKKYIDKLIFVVNKYANKIGKTKLTYTVKVIRKRFNHYGFGKNNIFPLEYDAELINDSNEQRLLNFIESNNKSKYVMDLNAIIKNL